LVRMKEFIGPSIREGIAKSRVILKAVGIVDKRDVRCLYRLRCERTAGVAGR